MIRTLDAADINRIASHPEVRPFLGFTDPTAPINLDWLANDTDNFCILTPNRDGAYVLHRRQAGLYAAHTLALPQARGRPMVRLMREGFAFMFTATDCVEIVTQIPDGADNARAWSDLAGFRDTFRREACFPFMGETVGSQFRSLTYGDWVTRDTANRKAGEAFHDTIHAHGLADHPHDPVHDAWVGATLLGVGAHNIVKAVGLYNRFAATANYHQAAIKSYLPPVIDTGDAVLSLLNGTVNVLQTRPARGALDS